jgi:hypothetical protein
MRSFRNSIAVIVWYLSFAATEAETIFVGDTETLQSALFTARDGDEILLAPGTYRGRFFSSDLVGVTIRSADKSRPAVINARGFGEGIKLASVSRVTIADLIIEQAANNGINIDDSSTFDYSTDITIQNVVLRDMQDKGILLAGVDGFHIDRISILGWGGSAAAISMAGAHNGIIERSLFDNVSPGVGVGVQTKGGSSNVTIRANRFVDANERSIQIGGATALPQHRPQPPTGVEASKIVVEGNVVINEGRFALPDIRSAVSFVGVADGVARNNFIMRPTRYMMRILKENREAGFVDTQNGQFLNNIIVWDRGDLEEAINVGSSTLASTFRFEGNQWFNRTSPDRSTPILPSAEVNGIYGVDPGLTVDSLIPWSFEWGQWVVNASAQDQPLLIDSDTPLFLATPGDGAQLDLNLDDPLLGPWSFDKIDTTQGHVIEAFSYALLFKQPKATPCDFDLNGSCDVTDIDLLSQVVRAGTHGTRFDLNSDGQVDQEDRRVWVEDLMNTYFGDSNLDGEFNTRDLVNVFISSEYEDAEIGNSSWRTGDWDGDGDFGTSDLVTAFVSNGFEKGPRAATAIIPEPSSLHMLMMSLSVFAFVQGFRKRRTAC